MNLGETSAKVVLCGSAVAPRLALAGTIAVDFLRVPTVTRKITLRSTGPPENVSESEISLDSGGLGHRVAGRR